jgi:hypothetical protein
MREPGKTSRLSIFAATLVLAALLAAGRDARAQGAFYAEEAKEGRIYVFNDMTAYSNWQKTGEAGKSITRVGACPQGETIVFDSEEAIHLYNFRHNLPAEVFEKKEEKKPETGFKLKVGGTIFADYTYTKGPTANDADGNSIHSSAFNVGRAYLNLSGNLTPSIAFRITPDITRESGSGSSLSGSYTYRLKYAYGQWNLDEWLGKGFWVRLGMQPTAYPESEESAYRYRFQGPIFVDREGFLPTADSGISVQAPLPGEVGEVQVGWYNGEGYSKAEANDQKSFQGRLGLKPFSGALAGLGFTLYGEKNAYLRDGAKDRYVARVGWDSPYLNASFAWLDAKDRTSKTKPEVKARGWSAWIEPKSTFGLEGLLRYDRLEPNRNLDSVKTRLLVGASWWFSIAEKGPKAAVMIDHERVKYDDFSPARPEERRWAIHTLLSF